MVSATVLSKNVYGVLRPETSQETVGTLAKFLVPGRDPSGCLVTVLLGVVGAFIGGFLFTRFGAAGVTGLNLYSILVAIVGAVVVLFIYHAIVGRRTL